MNEFSVKSIRECVTEESKEFFLKVLVVVYLIGVIFNAIGCAFLNGTISNFFEFAFSVGPAIVITFLVSVYVSYYYDALDFPQYIEMESSAIYLFSNNRISIDDFLFQLKIADEKRNEFWKNKSRELWYSTKSLDFHGYSKKRHLERTLSKYPKYLQIEFDAYQYLNQHGDDAIFRGMLEDVEVLRRKEINSLMRKDN